MGGFLESSPAPSPADGDFQGLPRPIDGDNSMTSEWDIGPYEHRYLLFADGFESGGVTAWSASVP